MYIRRPPKKRHGVRDYGEYYARKIVVFIGYPANYNLDCIFCVRMRV